MSMPSAPPCGISTSALKVYDVFSTLGASPYGVSVSGCAQVNTLRPAVMLGRGVMVRVTVDESSGSTWYFLASTQKRFCSSFSFAGYLAARFSDWVQSLLRSYSSHG